MLQTNTQNLNVYNEITLTKQHRNALICQHAILRNFLFRTFAGVIMNIYLFLPFFNKEVNGKKS